MQKASKTMPKYIDAEWLHSHFKETGDEETKTNFERMMHRWIDIAPAADVAPVVHGKWIKGKYCSSCEYDNTYICCEETKFCPNCGARMDGDKNTPGGYIDLT